MSETNNKPRLPSITRAEAEAIVRKIIARRLGEPMEKDLFKRSVDELMDQVNGQDAELADDNNNE